jgi:2,4-dienoyl-CoA reductase-like NADH-dependent reductase (Old Yellow Enzyme family)
MRSFGATGPSVLFRPFTLGRLRLRNRIVMAPMTRESAPNGIPTGAMAAYYRRRAAGGVGLVITEGTPPDESGAFGASVPRFHGANALQGWAEICRAAHDEGACIVPQLWHVGASNPSLVGMTDSIAGAVRVSPSGLAGPDVRVGEVITQFQIDRTIGAFADAAGAAARLGFDGIEIHGAHGYLVDQFFWSVTNRRVDKYGGGIANRTRFAVELVEAIRRRVPSDFPIILRLSQWKQLDYDARLADTPDELAALLQPLVAAGVDMFHCSTRRFWDPAFVGSPLSLAGWTRKLSGKPVIAVGSVTLSNDFKSAQGKQFAAASPGALDLVIEMMERGDFDLIAVGRALLANADWAIKVREGRLAELQPFSREMLQTLT